MYIVTVADKSISTEGSWTTDLSFECPSALQTELIGKFLRATASRSTLCQHCYIYISEGGYIYIYTFKKKIFTLNWKSMRKRKERL